MVMSETSIKSVSEQQIAAASDLLKRLAHPVRLAVVCHLTTRECSVGEMEDALGLSQPALSQQLAELRTAGILASRRVGKSVIYRLAEPRAKVLVETLHSLFCSGTTLSKIPAATTVAPIAAAVFARVVEPAVMEPS